MQNERNLSNRDNGSIDIEASAEHEKEQLIESSRECDQKPSGMSTTSVQVLVLLAVQNCSKNLLMRYVMKDKPQFLLSAAIIIVEILKLLFSAMYIVLIDKKPLVSIWTFLKEDSRNTRLLTIPATSYSIQMTLEYVAFANIDASVFAVLVQTKMLTTGIFFVTILGKKLAKKQVISLILLTAGVMICNMKYKQPNEGEENEQTQKDQFKGILATLGIAVSSGFASVYTEKVIKAERNKNAKRQNYSLAYMQAQLAIVSLVILGFYATAKDFEKIMTHGLLHNFNGVAFLSCFNSAVGGLIVATVLKYADSVLKGYATAVSVVLTGVLSQFLFGTQLDLLFWMGMIIVVCSVVLYNASDLNKYMC